MRPIRIVKIALLREIQRLETALSLPGVMRPELTQRRADAVARMWHELPVAALDDALRRVHEHGHHTYRHADLLRLAQDGERTLEARGVPVAHRVGTRYDCRSGTPNPQSGGKPITTTRAVLLRNSGGWHLEHVEKQNVVLGVHTDERRILHISPTAWDDVVRHATRGMVRVEKLKPGNLMGDPDDLGDPDSMGDPTSPMGNHGGPKQQETT